MSLRTLAARAALLALVAGTAAGCTTFAFVQGPAMPARGTAEVCEPLFREFDRLARRYGAGPPPDITVSQPLARQGDRLMRADCISRSRHLDAMAQAPRTAVVARGAPISPISVHAGAVPGLLTEFQARAYFRDREIRVRSVGEAALGRRIYLGPFNTEGALADAMTAAREAGFVAPYPARF